MDDTSVQRVWKQLEHELFCGDCTAARFLIWEKGKHADTLGDSTPQHSVVKDDCWYAVHCDYFMRRVEAPDKLCQCGAHQKKGKDEIDN